MSRLTLPAAVLAETRSCLAGIYLVRSNDLSASSSGWRHNHREVLNLRLPWRECGALPLSYNVPTPSGIMREIIRK